MRRRRDRAITERKTREDRLRDLYLNVMKQGLTGHLHADEEVMSDPRFATRPGSLFKDNWPPYVHTMVGPERLEHLRRCVETILDEQIPGDLIECGVWRGGASIFTRAVLKSYGKTERTVWVADSFEGLPPPDPELYPADAGAKWHEREDLAVSVKKVRANFRRFGLLDARVRFLPGFFRDTLPQAPIEALALIRLDGDMYESTWDGLSNLYPKLSPGGFLIIDDYGAVEACRQAVHDYRREHNVDEPIEKIDWTGAFWRRSA